MKKRCTLCGLPTKPNDRTAINDGTYVHKSCRNQRDENGARASLSTAITRRSKIGFAVDDMERVELAAERVICLADKDNLEHTIERTEYGIHIRFPKFGRGEVYVFAADKLIPPNQRPN